MASAGGFTGGEALRARFLFRRVGGSPGDALTFVQKLAPGFAGALAQPVDGRADRAIQAGGRPHGEAGNDTEGEAGEAEFERMFGRGGDDALAAANISIARALLNAGAELARLCAHGVGTIANAGADIGDTLPDLGGRLRGPRGDVVSRFADLRGSFRTCAT